MKCPLLMIRASIDIMTLQVANHLMGGNAKTFEEGADDYSKRKPEECIRTECAIYDKVLDQCGLRSWVPR